MTLAKAKTKAMDTFTTKDHNMFIVHATEAVFLVMCDPTMNEL